MGLPGLNLFGVLIMGFLDSLDDLKVFVLRNVKSSKEKLQMRLNKIYWGEYGSLMCWVKCT